MRIIISLNGSSGIHICAQKASPSVCKEYFWFVASYLLCMYCPNTTTVQESCNSQNEASRVSIFIHPYEIKAFPVP